MSTDIFSESGPPGKCLKNVQTTLYRVCRVCLHSSSNNSAIHGRSRVCANSVPGESWVYVIGGVRSVRRSMPSPRSVPVPNLEPTWDRLETNYEEDFGIWGRPGTDLGPRRTNLGPTWDR